MREKKDSMLQPQRLPVLHEIQIPRYEDGSIVMKGINGAISSTEERIAKPSYPNFIAHSPHVQPDQTCIIHRQCSLLPYKMF